MKRLLQLFILFPLLAGLSVGCGGTDVGNVDVDFALYDESFNLRDGEARSQTLGGTGGVAVTSAWLAVERVRLRDEASCDGGDAIEVVGPFAVDLLAPGPIPELTDVEVTTGSYCRFEFRWDTYDGPMVAGMPAELQGASLVLQGARADGIPFLIRSERGDEFRLDALDGGFPIDQATGTLFMAFEEQTLFTGVDLDAAVIGGDGTIVLDAVSNTDLLDVFNDNLRDAARLFDDDDDDGELDVAEHALDEILAQ